MGFDLVACILRLLGGLVACGLAVGFMRVWFGDFVCFREIFVLSC